MGDKITIIDTEFGFWGKLINFWTKKDLKVEIEVLNKKLTFYKKVEKTFFSKAKEMMENYVEKEITLRTLQKENKNLKKELSKLKNKEETKNKKKEKKRNFYLRQLDKLTGKKRDLFELYHIKKVKDKAEILSALEINNNYYRRLKFMIHEEIGVKIG